MKLKAVHFENVSKDFKTDFWKKKVSALCEINFSVEPGTIFGLVGPNGAGKTTAIKIMMGLIRPTKGNVTIFGNSVEGRAVKRDIGYLPENAYYYDYLRTEEVIDFYGRFFGLSRNERNKKTDELLEQVGLFDKKGLRLRQFSKGMLQRIGIAQAIVNDPKFVIFDEPMSGLDPIGRKEVRDIILRLGDQGKTILFSSHILTDVEALCDYVGIIIKGKLKACGPIGELIQPRVKNTEVIFHGKEAVLFPQKFEKKATFRSSGAQWIVDVVDPDILEQVINWGKSEKLQLVAMIPHKETLEDLFMKQVEES